MRFLVLVTPVSNEASIIVEGEARAALSWLGQELAVGSLVAAEAYPETGGYMIAETTSRAALDDLLGTYPLRHTITTEVHELVSLTAGFAVLVEAIAASETTP